MRDVRHNDRSGNLINRGVLLDSENVDGRCSEGSHSKQWIEVEFRRSNDHQTCAQQTSRCSIRDAPEREKEKNRYVPTDSRAPIRGEKSRMKTVDDWCKRNVYTSVCVCVCVYIYLRLSSPLTSHCNVPPLQSTRFISVATVSVRDKRDTEIYTHISSFSRLYRR